MHRLKVEEVTSQILPEGDGTTRLLGFNGSTPGPELRVRRGERVTIDVENALEEGTAVHWHGIRLENSMDGVPMLTQNIIEAARDRMGDSNDLVPTSLRQKIHLQSAIKHLGNYLGGHREDIELRAEDLRLAADSLGRLTGRIDAEDVLDQIFSRFCIGK